MSKSEAKRKPGRPRTRPEGVRERCVYLTDAEYAGIRSVADTRGVSVAELLRQTALSLIQKKKSSSQNPAKQGV